MLLRVLIFLTAILASHAWSQVPARNTGSEAGRSVAGEQRYALAIGINDYREVGRLEKAVNDARAMGRALEQAGFRVVVLTNAGRAEMNRAINQFVLNLSGGGQGVFFFAGHGVQINNQNYLLPVDVQSPQVEADVADQAISLQGIQDKLAEVRARFALLVVDACRDNPLPRKAGRTLGGTRGLAQASSAEGQMVVFSAGANQQALDTLSPQDSNPNGVFTREFLPWIGKPGVSVRDAVLQVRSAVRARARARSVNHEQFPAVYDQVDGNFYFLPGALGALAAVQPSGVPAPTPALQSAPAPAPAPEPVAVDPAEAAFWAEARRLDDPAAYVAYLSAYPDGQHSADARAAIDQARRTQEPQRRIAEEQAWAKAEAGASAASYSAYLGVYPNGRFAALAKLKRERLGGSDKDFTGIWHASACPGAPGWWGKGGPPRDVTITLSQSGNNLTGKLDERSQNYQYSATLSGRATGVEAQLSSSLHSKHSMKLSTDRNTLTDNWCNKDDGCAVCAMERR